MPEEKETKHEPTKEDIDEEELDTFAFPESQPLPQPPIEWQEEFDKFADELCIGFSGAESQINEYLGDTHTLGELKDYVQTLIDASYEQGLLDNKILDEAYLKDQVEASYKRGAEEEQERIEKIVGSQDVWGKESIINSPEYVRGVKTCVKNIKSKLNQTHREE
jgi:hypothetical protein